MPYKTAIDLINLRDEAIFNFHIRRYDNDEKEVIIGDLNLKQIIKQQEMLRYQFIASAL